MRPTREPGWRAAAAGTAAAGWAIEAWGAQPAYAVPILAGGCALAIVAARYAALERAELAAAAEPARELAQAPSR